MTVEEYRQRMIEAFHNADCDNLIALVALPSEKEFEHLEWLLKNHYLNQKQEPCEDCISREATVKRLCKVADFMNEKREGLGSPYIMAALFIQDNKEEFPSVTPKEKTGYWIDNADKIDAQFGRHTYKCSECGKYAEYFVGGTEVCWDRIKPNFCPNCGARMVDE